MARPPKTLDNKEEIVDNLSGVETEVEIISSAAPEPFRIDQPKVELKDNLYTIVRNPENQRFAVVTVAFDFKTKTFGEVTVVEENIDRYVSIERFRVLVGNGLMSWPLQILLQH